MTEPEQPASPPLTRKQLREIRNTGSTPVIAAEPQPAPPQQGVEPQQADASSPSDEPQPSAAPAEPLPVAESQPVRAVPAPFPRPAEPAAVPPPPVADRTVDLGVSPLTRRQARQQERIRTASVPVITPEVIAAHAAGHAGASAFVPPPAVGDASVFSPSVFAQPDQESDAPSTDSGVHALFGLPRTDEPETPAEAQERAEQPGHTAADEPRPAAAETVAPQAAEPQAPEPKAVVNPLFGAGLLADERAPVPVEAELPPSFDQLLSRGTGSVAAQNTLIVSQTPDAVPLVAPVAATGEVIITGTFNLPEGLGSTGHAPGTADGKEIDATLIDGELPSHSSPTPIAASAAVSTVKTPGEVIKPPAPEKGSKLMISLAITAGVLALALVGVLILAFATGVL